MALHESLVLVAIAFSTALIAVIISFYHMYMHAKHYTRPKQQRFIGRILFMSACARGGARAAAAGAGRVCAC